MNSRCAFIRLFWFGARISKLKLTSHIGEIRDFDLTSMLSPPRHPGKVHFIAWVVNAGAAAKTSDLLQNVAANYYFER